MAQREVYQPFELAYHVDLAVQSANLFGCRVTPGKVGKGRHAATYGGYLIRE
jgi:hypothetical protein